jgi:hypothetical protein
MGVSGGGMSADQGRDVDPEMIKAGGEAFKQRLAQFKSAKDAAEKAQADLRLAQDAASAYASAQTVLNEATATATGMIAEAKAKSEAMVAEGEKKFAEKKAQRDGIMSELRALLAEMQQIRQGW